MRRNSEGRAVLGSIVSDLRAENRAGLIAWLSIPENREWAENAVTRALGGEESVDLNRPKVYVTLLVRWRIRKPPKNKPKWGPSYYSAKRDFVHTRRVTKPMYADVFMAEWKDNKQTLRDKVDKIIENDQKRIDAPTAFLWDAGVYLWSGPVPRGRGYGQSEWGILIAKDSHWTSPRFKEDGWDIERSGLGKTAFDSFFQGRAGERYDEGVKVDAPSPAPAVTTTPSPPPKRRATVKGVNKALSALGFTSDELEFVRGQGYFYVSGEIPMHLYETGLYGISPRVSDLSVDDWVRSILSHVMDDQNFASLTDAQQAKIERAMESQNA